MEASIRGHGARHRTGSLSLAPSPPPLGFRAFFPPFCSSCTALLSLGGLLIGIETRQSLLGCSLHVSLLLHLRSSALRFFSSSPHTLFSTRHDLVARSFAFFPLVFFELSILSMKIVRERMQFLHRIETKGDCHEDCH